MTLLEYGAVIVTRGKYKGRIGYYDCESDIGKKGIVYWGDMLLCLDGYTQIPFNFLSNDIPTLNLVERIEQLRSQIGRLRAAYSKKIDYFLCTQLLSELVLAENILNEKYINTMYLKPLHGICVFISHSSNDLEFSRCLATDLKEIGYDVFLDDWSIDLGENIMEKINAGLEKSMVLIPVVSKKFLESIFCTDEWTSLLYAVRKIKEKLHYADCYRRC